jgi:hypothetical protein
MGDQGRERSGFSPAAPGGLQAQHLGDVVGKIEGGLHESGFMANRLSVKGPFAGKWLPAPAASFPRITTLKKWLM